MTKLTKRYRLISLLVVLISLVVAFYVLLTINQRAEIRQLEKKVNSYNRENNDLEKFLITNEDLLSERLILEKRLSEFELMLPLKAKENKFIDQFKKLIINNNLKFKELKPGLSENEENYKSLNYYFKLEGLYPDWLEFLADLNQLKRVVKLKELNLSQKDELLEIDLELKIYYLGSDDYV